MSKSFIEACNYVPLGSQEQPRYIKCKSLSSYAGKISYCYKNNHYFKKTEDEN